MLNLTSKVEGFVKITDADTGEVLLDGHNSIHYENLSLAIAQSLADMQPGIIQEMHFGDGGAVVSGSGVITYLPPNTTGPDADLYNNTYYKVVNNLSPLNTDILENFITINHLVNSVYSDIIITCTLDYSEPSDQSTFDDATQETGNYVFNEIGLKVYDPVPQNGNLIAHIIFSPIQKSLNRKIVIQYTLRINLC